jgi:hypothetical protein
VYLPTLTPISRLSVATGTYEELLEAAEAAGATDAQKASHTTTSPRGPSDGDALLDLKILVIVVKNIANENILNRICTEA